MKVLKRHLTLFLGLILFSGQAFALVDYSEAETSAPTRKKTNRIKINKRPGNSIQASRPSPSRGGGGATWGDFSIGTSYQSSNVEIGEKAGKVNAWHFEGRFQTNYGFYLSANHYIASSDSSDLADTSEMQQGNPVAKIGFNWLQFGGGADAGTIDIIAGASVGQSNSDFATSRTDKIFGLETTKKIASMVLGIGYEYRMTGAAGEEELSVGNIQQIYAVLGWMATPDIRFSLEAGTYKIGLGEGAYSLEEKTSFGYVSPQLHLGISPLVSLDLGAIFRTKRLGNDSLVDARLYDLKGAYGSSILAGLSIAL